MGRRFPFVNRLAVESVLQTHPGARITIHFSDPPDNADWRALQAKAEFRPIDVAGLLAGLPPSLAGLAAVMDAIAHGYPAGKSNILRYLILFREGGVYLDFDTLTVRDLGALWEGAGWIGEELVFRCDDDRVAGRIRPEIIPFGLLFGASYYLSRFNCRWLGASAPLDATDGLLRRLWSARKLNNAVLACEPGSPFFARALELLPKADPAIRFNLGPILMNRAWDLGDGDGLRRLPPEFFYFIPPSQTFRFFLGPAPALPPTAHVLHWCSSNHKDLAATLDARELGRPRRAPPLYYKLAREILERGI